MTIPPDNALAASKEAMRIAEKFGSLSNHNMLCPRSRGLMGDCICDRCDVDALALAIDAALEQARREERERVKAVVQWFVDMPGAFDDDGILTDIIEAIEDPTIKFEPWSKES